MKIVCANCEKNYRISEEKLPQSGFKFKCKCCSSTIVCKPLRAKPHVWKIATLQDGFPASAAALLKRYSTGDRAFGASERQGANLSRQKFKGADLQGVDLRRANLAASDFSNANLERSNLEDTNFNGSLLVGVNLSNSILCGSSLVSVNLREARLFKADLHGARMEEANLEGADLRHSILSGVKFVSDYEHRMIGVYQNNNLLRRYRFISPVNLRNADLEGADLRKAICVSARFIDANLTGANFSEACLMDVDFSGADLSRANLRKADLRRSDLVRAEFGEASLVGADLRDVCAKGANFVETDLTEALLTDANLGHAQFADSNLDHANLDHVRAQYVNLERANLAGSSMVGATLRNAALCNANLRNANLHNADLKGADLQGADLTGARVEGVVLVEADLRSACLSGLKGRPVEAQGVIIDHETFRRSEWSASELSCWRSAGATIANLEMFPPSVHRALFAEDDGLTICFDTRITAFDRYLIDGVIFGVLGKETDCRVVEYEELKGCAVVRIVASDPRDLDAVASVLWGRVWEELESRKLDNANAMAQLMTKASIELLTELREKIEFMLLRLDREQRQAFADVLNALPSAAVHEMMEDQAAVHLAQKDARIVKTWPDRVRDAVVEAGFESVPGGQVVKAALDKLRE